MNLINREIFKLEKSATLAINEKVTYLRSKGRKIYSFGLGQSPFPVPECVVQALKEHAKEKDYLPVQGLPELCAAVAKFHQRNDEVVISEDGVIIGPGSKELMFILQLCLNVEVVIPTPCWVSYYPQSKISARKTSYIHTTQNNHWNLTSEQLEIHCKNNPNTTQLLILNYPSNPCGTTYDITELKKLADVAKAYNVIILSDEIYGRIHHKGAHISIARFYPEGTIISGGLSKWCGAGGWRLGTFAFPQELMWLKNAMTVVASETYTSVSAPIQYAAVLAFKGNEEIENYLYQCRKVLSALGEWIFQSLNAINIKVEKPVGGFYILPDFSYFTEKLKIKGIESSDELSSRLLEEIGVATLPGSCFGLENSILTIRMSYVDFDGEKAIKATNNKEINQFFLETHCGNVVEGIRKLINWLGE